MPPRFSKSLLVKSVLIPHSHKRQARPLHRIPRGRTDLQANATVMQFSILQKMSCKLVIRFRKSVFNVYKAHPESQLVLTRLGHHGTRDRGAA